MEWTHSSFNEFLLSNNEVNVICFGRSEGFLSFSRMMNSMQLDGRINYLVDNDDSVWGTYVPGYDKKWEVCSPQKLKDENQRFIIVITVRSKDTAHIIANQLKEILRENIEIIHYQEIYTEWIDFKKNRLQFSDRFRIYENTVIPKTIHYCWFGKNPLPDRYVAWMSSWKAFCPDYEIIRWDESNYDVQKNEYMKAAYDAGKWSFVSDYARLDIIYHNGGIYLDTDVELIRSMDDFLYEEGFAGYLPDERINTGLGFGARKGLPIIKALMDDYDNREFVVAGNRKEKISIQMCSEIQTQFLLRNPNWRYTNDIVDMDGLRVYPSPILDGLNADEETRKKISYSIHHYAGSWLNEG